MINMSSEIVSNFDFLVDGQLGLFAYVSQSLIKDERSIYVTKIEIDKDGNIIFINSNPIRSDTGKEICPNEIQFESTPDFNQKFRFIVKS